MMATSSKLLQEKEIVVEFQDVSYRVGKSNLLFKINLSIPKGELLVLLSYFAVANAHLVYDLSLLKIVQNI